MTVFVIYVWFSVCFRRLHEAFTVSPSSICSLSASKEDGFWVFRFWFWPEGVLSAFPPLFDALYVTVAFDPGALAGFAISPFPLKASVALLLTLFDTFINL